jgi:hypothetical protein
VKRIHGEGRPGCTVTCGQCDRTVLLSGLGQHVLDNHLNHPLADRSWRNLGGPVEVLINLFSQKTENL